MKSTKGFTFNLFGFPVHVDPFFFLLAAILGGSRADLTRMAIWIGVVFVSVLAHELGHAFIGRQYGLHPAIELYTGGGLTWWQSSRPLSHFEEFSVSLAGPAIGLVVGGMGWMLQRNIPLSESTRNLHIILLELLWINIVWSLLNLLPMLPLDGGNIMRVIVQKIRGYRDERLPLMISIGTGVIIFLAALSYGSLWGMMLCGWFTYRNYQQLQQFRIRL